MIVFLHILLLAACFGEVARSETSIDVDVGEDGFVFKPSVVMANPGDKVEFKFYPGVHSVANSDFGDPCHPSQANQIWSGFVEDTRMRFVLEVNDTTPIWLYCAQVGHCAAGMSMVINPP